MSSHVVLSCNFKGKDKEEEFYLNEEITSYVKAFKSDANKRNVFLGSDVTIAFSKGKGSIMYNGTRAIGLCKPSSREVLIEDYQWNFLNSTARKMLIYHELGHCLISRKHEDSYLKITNYPGVVQVPASFMHRGLPQQTDQNFYIFKFIDENWNLFTDELMHNDLNAVKNLGELVYVSINELISKPDEEDVYEDDFIYD